MEQESDQKHTSKSISEWLKKTKQNEGSESQSMALNHVKMM